MLLDHLVVFGGQRNDAELEVPLRPRPFGDQTQPPVSEASSEEETMFFTASTALSVSASSALTSFLVGSGPKLAADSQPAAGSAAHGRVLGQDDAGRCVMVEEGSRRWHRACET